MELVLKSLEEGRPNAVRAVSMLLGKHSGDAEDLVQDQVINLWKAFEARKFELRDGSCAGLLVWLSKRSALSMLRRGRVRYEWSVDDREPDEPEFVIRDDAPNAEDRYRKIDSESELAAKISLLNMKHRKAFQKVVVEGKDVRSSKLRDEAGELLAARDEWIEANRFEPPPIGMGAMQSVTYWMAAHGVEFEEMCKRYGWDEGSMRDAVDSSRRFIDACVKIEGHCKREQFIRATYREAARLQKIWLNQSASARNAMQGVQVPLHPYIPKPDGIVRRHDKRGIGEDGREKAHFDHEKRSGRLPKAAARQGA